MVFILKTKLMPVGQFFPGKVIVICIMIFEAWDFNMDYAENLHYSFFDHIRLMSGKCLDTRHHLKMQIKNMNQFFTKSDRQKIANSNASSDFPHIIHPIDQGSVLGSLNLFNRSNRSGIGIQDDRRYSNESDANRNENIALYLGNIRQHLSEEKSDSIQQSFISDENDQSLDVLQKINDSQYQDSSIQVQEIANFREEDIEISLIKHYKDFSFFRTEALKLIHLCRIQNKVNLSLTQHQLKAKKFLFRNYFKLPNDQSVQVIDETLGTQFIGICHKIPSHTIIYFSIKQVVSNRFNMLARSSSGELIAFYQRILQCKIISKIIKLVRKIRSDVVIVINDTSPNNKAICQAVKLTELRIKFIYCFQNLLSKQFKVDKCLIKQGQIYRKQRCFYTSDSGRIFSFSEIFLESSCFSMGIDLVRKLIEFEVEDNEILEHLRGNIAEQDKQLSLDFIVCNVARIFKCSTHQIFEIIQNLFESQQKDFITRTEMRIKKYHDWENTKDKNSHFPERMSYGRLCKRCQNLPKKKLKKSTFRCQGCSASLKKDIPLCPECFSDFHENFQYYHNKILKQNRKVGRKKDNGLNDGQKQQENQSFIKLSSSSQHNQFASHSRQIIPRLNIKTSANIVRMDRILHESIQLINNMIQNNHLHIVKLFLSCNLIDSLTKMNDILKNHDQLFAGLSAFGQNAVERANKVASQKGKSQIFRKLLNLKEGNAFSPESLEILKNKNAINIESSSPVKQQEQNNSESQQN